MNLNSAFSKTLFSFLGVVFLFANAFGFEYDNRIMYFAAVNSLSDHSNLCQYHDKKENNRQKDNTMQRLSEYVTRNSNIQYIDPISYAERQQKAHAEYERKIYQQQQSRIAAQAAAAEKERERKRQIKIRNEKKLEVKETFKTVDVKVDEVELLFERAIDIQNPYKQVKFFLEQIEVSEPAKEALCTESGILKLFTDDEQAKLFQDLNLNPEQQKQVNNFFYEKTKINSDEGKIEIEKTIAYFHASVNNDGIEYERIFQSYSRCIKNNLPHPLKEFDPFVPNSKDQDYIENYKKLVPILDVLVERHEELSQQNETKPFLNLAFNELSAAQVWLNNNEYDYAEKILSKFEPLVYKEYGRTAKYFTNQAIDRQTKPVAHKMYDEIICHRHNPEKINNALPGTDFGFQDNGNLDNEHDYSEYRAKFIKHLSEEHEKTLEITKDNLESYKELQRNLSGPDPQQTFSFDKNINDARKEALKKTLANPAYVEKKKFKSNMGIESILRRHNLSPAKFLEVIGSSIQIQSYEEIVNILDETVRVEFNDYHIVGSSEDFKKSFVNLLEASRQSTEIGTIRRSFDINDFCTVFLRCIKGVGKGIASGLENAVESAYNMVAHPIDTAGNLIMLAASASGKLIQIKIKNDIILNTLVQTNTTLHKAFDFLEETMKPIDDSIDLITQTFLKKPIDEKIESIAEFTTEQVAGFKINYLIGKGISSFAKAGIVGIRKLGRAAKLTDMLRYPESAVATIAAEALADGSSEILTAANRSTSEARTITNSLSKKACDEAKNIVSKIPENDFQNLKFKEIPRCCFEPKKIPLSRKETAKVWKTLAKRAQAKNPSRTNIPMEELAKDFESVANEIRAAKTEIKNNPRARSKRSGKRGARQQQGGQNVVKEQVNKTKNIIIDRFKEHPNPPKEISDIVYSKTMSPNSKQTQLKTIMKKFESSFYPEAFYDKLVNKYSKMKIRLKGTSADGEICKRFLKHLTEIQHKIKKQQKIINIDPTGLHFITKEIIENNPTLKLVNKSMLSDGCFKADYVYNGLIKKGSSFFSMDMTLEKLLDEMIKTINNFKGEYHYWEKSKTFEIRIKLFEKIECLLVYNEEGKLITFYPE